MNKNCNNISSQRNKYSIRKLTVGTASLLIGATLVFGLGNEAYADELASQEKNNTVANSNENSEPHEQQESTTVDKSQEQSVQQSTQEQTAHETKHIDEAQQSTNETTSKPNAIQHEHIDKDVTNEHASNEEQQNKEESIETQAEPINNKEESVLTEHKPEETKQQITEAEASTEERETSSLEAPENSNVNNSINKPQIIRPEEQKNENTKESRKVNGQAQPDKQSQNKKLRKVVATHEASTRTLKRTKRQTTANRDKTEDASFEALKYSDNYTFQTLIFDPEKLLKDDILKGKNIPFRIHSYMIGANSGERYKINLQLDEVIANHVTKISAIPANQTTPVEFNRVITPEGKRTNIWQVNYIRANNGLFGGAEILSQYTAEGGMIELDDTVGNILNAETDLDGDKLNYLIYVKDSLENTKIRTSESSGYFITKADKSFTNLKLSTSTAANSAFKASSGSVQFDPTIGKYGAFVGDQQILKNGILNYGGPLLDLGLNKQWVYFYKIDPKLIPFADSIELHKYDFKGLAGFDKTYYEETLVAKLPLSQNGEGSITAYDLNTLIEFNNSLPETVGIRIVVKFNQSPNNILIRDGKFDENGNIIPGTSKVREEFTFYGYFTDREGGLIENTFGTSTYYIQDKDRDGLTDSFEIHSSHTDPENADTDNDGDTDGNEYMNLRTSPLISKPKVENVTTDMNSIYGRVDIIDDDKDLEVSIVDFNNKEIGKGKVDIYGQFDIKVSHLTPGKYTAKVMSKKYTNPESTTFDVIDITKALKPTIEPVTDIDPNIGILGLSGSTITVKDDKGKFIGRVDIAKDQTGNFIILKKPLKAGTVLIATAKRGKYTSIPSDSVIVKDTSVIDAPTVNPVINRDTSITGKSEPEAVIKVLLPDGNELLTLGDLSGKFEVKLPTDYRLKVGDVIQVSAIDRDSRLSPTATVVVQAYAGFPMVQPVTSESTQINGLATPSSLIKVKLPNGTFLNGQADELGDFTVSIPNNVKFNGGERLELSAISQPGNFALSTPIQVEDATAPVAPTVNEYTDTSTQLSGTTEAGATVKVELPDGTELSSVADNQGNYSVNMPTYKRFNGGEQIKVTSTDAAGNKSEATVIAVKDTTPPVAPTVGEVTSESTQVTGTGEPGSTVKVELPDGTELSGVSDNQGNYVIDIPSNKKFIGGERIKVTSTDASGNKSGETVIDVKDTTPPVVPTVSEVTSESTQVTGTGEAGSTVKVELPDGTVLNGVADDQGNFEIDLPTNNKFNGGERIKVTSTDASGNKSEETVIDVKDTTPPVAPTVSEVTSESTQVTGTGEAGSTVKVELPDGTVLNGVADAQGNYTIDLPANMKFNGGESIKVTSTDVSGNKSNETVIDVKDTTPPVAPTVNEVTSESTQVTGTGEPGSTVMIELSDATDLFGRVDNQGHFTIDIPLNKRFIGGERIKVASIDTSGNKSKEIVIDVKDTTPPVAPTVSEITSESTQVTGTGEPGSTVKIELPDGTELTGVADDQGNYVIDLPANKKFNGGESIKVTSTDASGNKSNETVIDVKDTTPPVAPTVSEVTSESTQVTGTGEPGSTVKVELPDGTELTGVADDQGNYTIDLPANKKFQGGESIKVTSTDASGNKSDEKVIDVKDTTPPVAPTVSEVTSESTQVTGTGEPGSTVKVELPDGTELTGVADDQGNYTIDLPANKKFNGGESIKVTSTDASGNKSDEKVIDVKDTTPPVAPTVSEVTSESTQVTGTGEPGSTVKVELPDGTELSAVTDDQGNYVIDLPANKKFNGGESIKVTSTDASGNKSDEKVIDVKDTTPPVVPTVSELTSESTQVTGTGEPGSTVKVELPDGTVLDGVADDQGNYVIDLPANKKFNGGESIKVTSTDASGNKSDEKVIDVKDTTPPVAPTVSEVTSESTQVTGTGEPGSTVKVELPDGTELTGVADDQGNYTIDFPANKKFNGGEQIKVTSTDASGNKSDEKVIDVKDTTPPVAPTVSEVTSESTQVTGTGEPGSTVKVELPDGTELTGVADDQGNYTIDLPSNKKFNGGESIKVTSTDASGNKSDEKVIDVKDTTPPVAPTVSEVTSESTQVTGTGEPGSTVKVELPDGTELTGVADDQGNYTIDLPTNKKFNGGESIKVTSTDASGNKSGETVIDVKDTTPPVAPTVSEVTSESTQVTGTGEPGSTVKVELPDGTEITGVADDQGNYTINLPINKKFNGGESIKVTSTDASGNKSDEKVIDVKDTTAPVTPTVTEVTSESTQVTGTGEPGSTVKVELPDGTEITGVADDQGNYTIDLPINKKFNGGESIKVTSTDASGNKSDEKVIDVKDTTPPVAPTVSEVTSESTQVTGTGEPGSTVKVELPDGTELSTVTDDQGNYTIDLPANKKFQGGESIKVTSTDASGNKSGETVIDVKDITPPVAPTVSEVTSESTQVTGTGEPGSTVKVELPDGTELSAVADDQGNYVIDLPTNKKFNGGESIKVTSTDASGNKSDEKVIDVKDTTPPVAPTVSEVTSESTQVTGTGEPGSTVKVELPDGTELTGVADDQGNYTIDLPANKKFQGGESIKVTSTDASGNKSDEKVIDVKDTTPPVAPTVSEVTSESTQVTGTGEPGSTVKVELPDGIELTGVADDQGNYTIDLPSNKKFNGGESIKITSTDASGNKSDEKVIDVKDTTAPVAPTVSEVTSESTQVTGTGEPGSTVKVELPDGTVLDGIADDQGNYVIDLPNNKKFQGGESIKVTSTDASGNKSDEKVIDVKDTTPPVAPTVSEVTSESTQVTGTGEPGSTVKVELPDGTELTGVADDQGNYTIDLPNNKKFQGGESIKVTSTDASGNKSDDTVIDVKDTTPPVAPMVSEVTSESTQVTGTGEPGSTVKVELPDGTELTGVADDQGNYTIDLPSNKKFNGGESIKITSTDASGNKSDEKVIDVKDTTAPVAPTVSEVTSESTQVTGTGEAGSTVKVELPDGTELTGVADDQGNYTIDLPANKKFNGGESIKITSTDSSGNKSGETVIDVKDTTPPISPTVDEFTSESTQVTGTGEPGSTVKVELPDGTELTGVADDQGNYTIDLPANKKFQGGEFIKVTSTDKSNNKSNETIVLVKDTTPPVPPTVDEFTSESTQVTGTGEPGSTIKMELPDGSELLGLADDQGNYIIDLPTNKKFNGGESVKITSIDRSGNKSDEKVIDVKDTTPPVEPTISEVTSESTQITGTSEPGSTVKVELPDGTELTAIADDQGNYTVDLPANNKFKGGESIKVTSTDTSGNKSNVSTVEVRDVTPPNPPKVLPITSESAQISGLAEPNAKIKLTIAGGNELTAVANDQGIYVIALPNGWILDGGEDVNVYAIDASGNVSLPTYIRVLDVTAPEEPIVNPITSESTQITGTTEPGATIKVELPYGTVLTGKADDQGDYTIIVDDANRFRGGEKVKITATDDAGNKSEVIVIDVKDTTPPVVPTVNPFTSQDTLISGTAEPDSIVKVLLPDGTELTATANLQGNYLIDIPNNQKFQGGEKIKLTATDQSGNTSLVEIIDVEDKTPPTPPTIGKLTSESMEISGTSEPGAKIIMVLPDDSELTAVADDQGNYTIDLYDTIFAGNETLRVTATDLAGNKSEATIIQVIDATPPEAPKVNQVTSDDNKVTGTSEENTTVTLTLPDGTELTGQTDDQGNYTIDIPANKQFQGGESIQLTTTDAAGNKSTVTIINVADVTPPVVPSVNPITTESTTITGTGEPQAVVRVELPDGTYLVQHVDDQGNYSIDIPSNTKFKGGEQLKVISIDKSFNTSEEKVINVADVTPPKEPVVYPILSFSQGVAGLSEPDALITVKLPSGELLKGKADNNGYYMVHWKDGFELQGGEIIEVFATDAAGNDSTIVRSTVIDRTPPEEPTVNEITSESKVISGNTEPLATIIVEAAYKPTLTVEADQNGNFTLQLPKDYGLQGGEQLKVISMDKEGNQSDVLRVSVTDVTPPKSPLIDEITSESKAITGKAEPLSIIEVNILNGTKIKGKADGFGNFIILLPDNMKLNGGETIEAIATDTSGNASKPTRLTVVDNTPPSIPTVNDLTSEDTMITGTGEVGSTVSVKLPDGTVLKKLVDNKGQYTIELPNKVKFKGGESLQVIAIDKAGNQSAALEIIVEDTTPPVMPKIDSFTTESKQLTGITEPGAVVNVQLPTGEKLSIKADDKGAFAIDLPSGLVFKGGEKLSITATDAQGNETSPIIIIVKDTTIPETPKVNKVTSESTHITGTAEPGALVKVKLPNGKLLTAQVDKQGAFNVELPYKGTFKGGEVLKVSVVDPSSNESLATTIHVEDITAPESPTVKPITSDNPLVVGTAEVGSTIKVKLPNGKVISTKVDKQGNYKVKIPNNFKLNGGESLIITATDVSGNTSEEITVKVTDNTAPTNPNVNPIDKDSKNILGTAEANATIKIKLPNGKVLVGNADSKGRFDIKVPETVDLSKMKSIKVIAIDANGNASNEVNVDIEQTNHTQDVNQNNGTANDQQSNISHSQALDHVQSDIEQDLSGQHNADKSMNSNRENEPNGSNHEQGELPSTGQNDAVNTTTYGSLMALIGSALLFTRRRKNNDKNKQDN
ncbi:YSIRK-type signal peptide-containing protein [Staphylococcus gallinarum]|uniref:Ig-like domain-containing protein n=1 Tax=Staphylococcus gallinarum TaxID=1293 RepID=UPI000E678964|nr:Ig-like domain-containing protein [Staphylococcus gallinarum]RIO91275.1 YSIRK-type signal peptide-containing protein [Staphylococcus gallinarum]